MKYEYMIMKWNKEYGWCLHMICGNPTVERAKEIMHEVEKEFPNDEFKWEKEIQENCWWNVYGTN